MLHIRLAYFLALLLSSGMCLYAQSVGGLRGQVIDPSGASVPKATITVTGSDGMVKAQETDQSGQYSIQGLAPGDYTVFSCFLSR